MVQDFVNHSIIITRTITGFRFVASYVLWGREKAEWITIRLGVPFASSAWELAQSPSSVTQQHPKLNIPKENPFGRNPKENSKRKTQKGQLTRENAKGETQKGKRRSDPWPATRF